MNERILYTASPVMIRNNPIGFVVAVFLCFFIIGIPILLVWYLRCLGTTLTVTNLRTTLRHGLLSKSTSEVWHKDVRNVRMQQSFFQRIFDVGTLAISSSGQADFEIAVSGIPNPANAKSIIDQNRTAAAMR